MRLRARILFFIVLTSVIPLIGLAAAASSIAKVHLAERITRAQVQSAISLADGVGDTVDDVEHVLGEQIANFRLDTAPDEARSGFLVATYRLFPEIAIATLVDASGQEISPAIYQIEGEALVVAGHDVVSPERLARFRTALPVPDPRRQITRGTPYLPPGEDAAVLPLAVASRTGDGIALGVELSLSPLLDRLDATAGEDREVFLLDESGGVLLRAGRAELVDPARFAPVLGVESADLRFDDRVLAATAVVRGRGWVVAIAEPSAAADAAATEIVNPTWYIGLVALCMAVVSGFMLTGSITRPVDALRTAANAVGGGDLARRVRIEGRDELSELGTAFNRMGDSLVEDAAKISAQSAEIEAFNRNLQSLVDSRTAQLKEAQARLVQSGQLAAVAEMSAGLAHELNNPLAGLLGLVQIVAMKRAGQPEEALLKAAEEQALRCKEILANLQRFTAAPSGEGGVGARDVVDLDGIVADVLVLVGGSIRQRGVEVTHETTGGLKVHGDAVMLGRALGQVLTAIRGVSAPGASLLVSGTRLEEAVELRFTLSQVVTSQDDWRAAGMGFWVARQILQEHSASLEEVESAGAAKIWRIVAPVAGAQ